jgi:hypothetical protein
LRKATPTFGAFGSGRGKMFFGACGDYGNYPRDAELDAFFDGPVHAIEFEYRDRHSDFGGVGLLNDFAQLKFHAVRLNARNPATTHFSAAGNIELLANLGAQHLRQVTRVIAGQSGAVSGDFISNPSAASHFFPQRYHSGLQWRGVGSEA